LNVTDDSAQVKSFCEALDFKTIVPNLIIKEITHPFNIIPPEEITIEYILLLKEWASVWASVRDSVWASVRDSVRALVWDSVGDSVRAYCSSFFQDIKYKYIDYNEGEENPYNCCIALFEQGLVPTFDGTTWRLQAGKKADVVFEISKKDLEDY
jgi:hypothetical protein